MKQGPDGLKEFTNRIRELFRLPEDVDISLTFGCKEPLSGQHLKLEGIGAFDAAVHCASVAAAERQQKLKSVGGSGSSGGASPTGSSGGAGSSNGASSPTAPGGSGGSASAASGGAGDDDGSSVPPLLQHAASAPAIGSAARSSPYMPSLITGDHAAQQQQHLGPFHPIHHPHTHRSPYAGGELPGSGYISSPAAGSPDNSAGGAPLPFSAVQHPPAHPHHQHPHLASHMAAAMEQQQLPAYSMTPLHMQMPSLFGLPPMHAPPASSAAGNMFPYTPGAAHPHPHARPPPPMDYLSQQQQQQLRHGGFTPRDSAFTEQHVYAPVTSHLPLSMASSHGLPSAPSGSRRTRSVPSGPATPGAALPLASAISEQVTAEHLLAPSPQAHGGFSGLLRQQLHQQWAYTNALHQQRMQEQEELFRNSNPYQYLTPAQQQQLYGGAAPIAASMRGASEQQQASSPRTPREGAAAPFGGMMGAATPAAADRPATIGGPCSPATSSPADSAPRSPWPGALPPRSQTTGGALGGGCAADPMGPGPLEAGILANRAAGRRMRRASSNSSPSDADMAALCASVPSPDEAVALGSLTGRLKTTLKEFSRKVARSLSFQRGGPGGMGMGPGGGGPGSNSSREHSYYGQAGAAAWPVALTGSGAVPEGH